MKALIHATLQFGAIFVPVGVGSSAGRSDIKLRTLHVCGKPIRKQDFCLSCNQVLGSEDLMKGWEVSKGSFITVDEKEMAEMSVERSRSIELQKFVPVEEVDRTVIERSYVLIPNEMIHRPYELLSAVLLEQKLSGIGRASLWGKEYPVAVDSDRGVLMMRYLFCNDELRSPAEVVASLKYDVSDEERDLASQFIRLREGHLDQDDLVNHSRERVMAYLEAKAAGNTIRKPDVAPEPEPTINLLDKLKEMVS